MKGQAPIEYVVMSIIVLVITSIVYHHVIRVSSNYDDLFSEFLKEISSEIDKQFCDSTSEIVIYYVHYDAEGNDWLNLNDEYVIIANLGCKEENLLGWQLKDKTGYTYVFPEFVLKGGKLVTVHTGSGTNSDTELYWGRGSPVWNNNGDTAYLYASNGTLIDSCSWTGNEDGEIQCS
jgi:hypothetical protein